MEISEQLESLIPKCLEQLQTDEWALVKACDNLSSNLLSHEAFASISDVLFVTANQNDEYAFSSCCRLIMQLAEISETTEIPPRFEEAIKECYGRAARFGEYYVKEVQEILNWYRYEIPI